MIDCQWVLKNFQWRNACNIEVIQSAESIFLNSDYKSSFESFSKSLDRLNNKAASVCYKIRSDIYNMWYFHKSYPTVIVDMKLRCCCCWMKLLWWMLWTVPSLARVLHECGGQGQVWSYTSSDPPQSTSGRDIIRDSVHSASIRTTASNFR